MSSPEALSWRERLVPAMPTAGWTGWAGPLGMGVLAATLRLPHLGQPRAFVFDETYYAKDAFSLLQFGYEKQTVDKANDMILGSNGDAAGLLSIFKPDASFVVHPPLGKWLIASGESVFGMTPFGWRIASAIIGIISVVLIARIARRLTRSNLLGTLAGLLVAIDGMHIVHSRTALLDLFMMFFVVAAFGAVLLDRDRTRARAAAWADEQPGLMPVEAKSFGPTLGWRPWLWAAGLSLGAACGVKWSGIYFVAAFGLLTVLWSLGLRSALGVRRPYVATLVRDAWPAFLIIVGLTIVTYVATWWGWFTNPGGYDRTWSPSALASLWHYHAEAMRFHVGLTSQHSYAANPWGWPVQARPTSFFYETPTTCGADKCSQEVLALGNPLIWWAGVLALFHQVWRWAGRRDWRAGAVLCGFVAGWAPWLMFQERTVFSFYGIVLLPFLVMALVLSLGAVLGPAARPERRKSGAIVVGAFVLAAVLASWFFYPIWTGEVLTYAQWNWRMWFPTWV